MIDDIREHLYKTFPSANNYEDDLIKDGWIKHDGSPVCPVPRASHIEMRVLHSALNDPCPGWDKISHYRLPNGWIYCDGKTFPSEIANFIGEVEYRCNDHMIFVVNPPYRFRNNYGLRDIVAFRKIKPDLSFADHYSMIPVCQGMPKEFADAGPGEWQYRTEMGMVVTPDYAASKLSHISIEYSYVRAVKLLPKRIDISSWFTKPLHELKKEVLNREAYERYKAAHPEPKPVLHLGEDGIEGAIFTALCEAMK